MAQPTYEEFLKAQGATDEDIKLLSTPIGRKAFDAAQTKIAEAEHLRAQSQAHWEGLKKWQAEIAEPTVAKAFAERDQALADSAANAARVQKLQELGLIKIAEQMEPGSVEPKKVEPVVTPPDMSKFVTAEQLKTITAAAGKGIARMANIAREHAKLGLPDVDFDVLYDEATASGQQLPEYWAQKFGVSEKRASAQAAEKAAYETKLKEEGAAAVRAEYQKSNPHLVAPQTSTSPFTNRPPSVTDAATQPWNMSETDLAGKRLAKGVAGLSKLTQ